MSCRQCSIGIDSISISGWILIALKYVFIPELWPWPFNYLLKIIYRRSLEHGAFLIILSPQMCFYTSSTVSRQKSEIDLPCHVWGLFSPPGAPVIQWLLNVLFLFVLYYLYCLFCITVTLSLYLSVCVYKSTNSQYVRFYSQTGFTLEEMYFFFCLFCF